MPSPITWSNRRNRLFIDVICHINDMKMNDNWRSPINPPEIAT